MNHRVLTMQLSEYTLAFIKQHNKAVVNKLKKLDALDEDELEECGLNRGSYLLNVNASKESISLMDEIEGDLNITLPKSYRSLLTDVGLLSYGSDRGFNAEQSYKMLVPQALLSLSKALETEWAVDWSQEPDVLILET